VSAYADLAWLGVRFRPLEHDFPPNHNRRWAPFRASLSDTLSLLARELRMLDAKRIVIQVALDETQIRNDGFPRSTARARHPGIAIGFDSKWGPLRYATDEFTSWDDNLRGIAKSMEALRMVDRYGVSKRGEQYTGWRAIPQTAGGDITTREAAELFIAEHGGSYREAARRLHPDKPGGDAEMFKRLTQAKGLVGA
jgi:hypothetical protein